VKRSRNDTDDPCRKPAAAARSAGDDPGEGTARVFDAEDLRTASGARSYWSSRGRPIAASTLSPMARWGLRPNHLPKSFWRRWCEVWQYYPWWRHRLGDRLGFWCRQQLREPRQPYMVPKSAVVPLTMPAPLPTPMSRSRRRPPDGRIDLQRRVTWSAPEEASGPRRSGSRRRRRWSPVRADRRPAIGSSTAGCSS
jgi:hypothetical protein